MTKDLHDNSLALLKSAQDEQLYDKLLLQLKKDFDLANIAIEVSQNMTASACKTLLHEKLYYLILEQFSDYLNVLYVVDVPEKTVKEISGSDVVEIAEQVAFLVLKRELQKVRLKATYG